MILTPETPWWMVFVILGVVVAGIVCLMLWEFSQWSDENWYET